VTFRGPGLPFAPRDPTDVREGTSCRLLARAFSRNAGTGSRRRSRIQPAKVERSTPPLSLRLSHGGPKVRIRLPPAKSQQRTRCQLRCRHLPSVMLARWLGAPDGPSDRRARLERLPMRHRRLACRPPHIPPGGAELCGRRADAGRQELTARPIVAWWTRRSPFAQTPSTNSQNGDKTKRPYD
jgi:hypothetical protein